MVDNNKENTMKTLFSPLWRPALRHLYTLLTQKQYFASALLHTRYGRQSRYKETSIKMNGLDLLIPDVASFLSTYDEIFNEQIYRFDWPTDQPKILDIGANIGLSVLYFKTLFPKAEITAFEADPHIFGYLEKNVRGSGYTDVRLLNRAVWNQTGSVRFKQEGADGGRIAGAKKQNDIEVPTSDLRQILEQECYDLIKIDVEGGECDIMPCCEGLLDKTSLFFVEYHSVVGKKQCLSDVIRILADSGFRLDIQRIGNSKSPLQRRAWGAGSFDLQLNIFGKKQ